MAILYGPGPSLKGVCSTRSDTYKELQGQCLRIVFPVSPARLYCCYAVIIVLTVAVVGLSVVLSLSGKKEQTSIKNTYAACPRMWIGFGNKCFYFSEDLGNWTVSESYCRAQGSQLAQIDNQEELNVLNRFKGDSATWIGLHRESSEHPWMWTDSTDYNNLFPIRGEGDHAYLSDRGISSGRDYIRRRWICSKPTSYTLQCPGVSQLVCDGHTYSAFTEGPEMCRDLELQWILPPDTLPIRNISLSLGNKSISQTGVSGSVRSPWL
ncbi:C-type lectin domain family 2 member F-like [Arvicola amphibius]|uniref:C-type lectin domain family 2 member F-like n=1 Tax=Arvicola amphibius TaxID=1047088 RepID=UPI001C09837D|nr:C-type lectin domain family 2 member F-like [Arvicola amphibius]